MHTPAPIHTTRATRLAAQRAQKAAQLQRRFMRITSTLVGLSLLATGLFTALSAHAATPTATSASASASTGTVQSVQPFEVKGKGSGAGVVAGALLGGLVGNQMGKGTGNAVMTVGGAVAGGYAGNEVEKATKKHTLYKTSVKLDDGSVHSYTESQAFAVGARVKVAGKHIKLAP